ncbi:hypothetical protein AMJ44_08800 [candidate division WOR-1 bacterium DG_54_3]|uniref:Uncharacterized protein n=1 Tax=candidate division WOR-1 bacterium DG_54_3 TaxID=1703775 RepID=A0A0S7XUM0_UNCSA|nr:MAG: hypothetical protein AMJ44_08800 [candidate division WOR-1 bacterium DG_54_3]
MGFGVYFSSSNIGRLFNIFKASQSEDKDLGGILFYGPNPSEIEIGSDVVVTWSATGLEDRKGNPLELIRGEKANNVKEFLKDWNIKYDKDSKTLKISGKIRVFMGGPIIVKVKERDAKSFKILRFYLPRTKD